MDNPKACYLAALWIRETTNNVTDNARADRWLGRLEELGEANSAEALWDLGQMHRFGDQVELNIDKANCLIERAAALGNPAAMHHLAWYLETEQYGFLLDQAAANLWYQKACEQGYAESLYVVALRKLENSNSYADAIRMLQSAAQQGYKPALEVLDSHLH
jgi:TPR repeat protein